MEQSDSEIIMETETDVCAESEMVLETIRKDLEEAGYQSVTIIIPACSVGAPHQRYRVFIVGYSDSIAISKIREIQRGKNSEFTGNGETMVNSEGERIGGLSIQPRESRETDIDIDGTSEVMENSIGIGRRRWSNGNKTGNNGKVQIERPSSTDKSEIMADTSSEGFQGEQWEKLEESGNGLTDSGKDVAGTCGTRWEKFDITSESAGQRHDTRCGNETWTIGTAQSGMGRNNDGISNRLHGSRGQQDSSGIFETFEEIFTTVLGQIKWPAGYGAEQYDYEPPRVATGVKGRANRLKALGNAIVPYQILPFLLAIKLINDKQQSDEVASNNQIRTETT